MRNRLIATLAAAAAGVALAAGPASATHDQNPPIRTEWMPCGQEDDLNCVWDAVHRGNGEGHSFFVARTGRQWKIPHHIAHNLITGDSRMTYRACKTPVSSDPVLCIWEERVWLGRTGRDWPIPASVGRYLLHH